MSDKVRDLPKRLQTEPLATKYPRIDRDSTLHETKADQKALLAYYPSATDSGSKLIWGFVNDPPAVGAKLLVELVLDDILSGLFNSLLLYRLLKMSYGPPDVLSAARHGDAAAGQDRSAFAMDWGYSVRIGDGLIAELRTKFSATRYVLRFWRTREHRIVHNEEYPFQTFSHDLRSYVEKEWTFLRAEEGNR